ncbi:hypothetical protein [Streptomyces sp. SID10815]|uniref:hypothetical protein n=1 Tax=Streptomyces sp. SID10815 TaxID=2706027 RepID=UPI0013C6FFE8|nr:hypothetical protein [Streptomyces sp. SID10815]NEA51999.1 hypothetical protein [Streptomyces sp. SID10815]
MDGGKIQAEEAGEWLRTNLRDAPDPKVNLSIEGDKVDSATHRRVLEILFRPRADGVAL